MAEPKPDNAPGRSSGRRRGGKTSATRAKLVEATRQLILEEGYAAVRARRVASKAGVKPPLVHYYFPSMDDLFVAVVRHGGDLNLENLARCLAAEQPLEAVWRMASDRDTAILSMQYLALATHRPAVRAASPTPPHSGAKPHRGRSRIPDRTSD